MQYLLLNERLDYIIYNINIYIYILRSLINNYGNKTVGTLYEATAAEFMCLPLVFPVFL